MKLHIPHLVTRPGRHDTVRHYWQPSAQLRRAGWKPVTLGTDADAAIRAAREWNARVMAWREGGQIDERPATSRRRIARHAKAGTVRQLIADFTAARFDHLADATRKQYASALQQIDTWAGSQPAHWITADRCRALLQNLARPAKRGQPERLHRAAGIGRVLRTLLKWAEENERIARNPMDRVSIRTPTPRSTLWPDHCIDAMVEMADAMGLAAIGTATLLAADTGQREADLLKLTWGKLPPRPSATGADGGRAIRLQQGKTGRWIDVPLTGRLSDRLAITEAENRQRPVPSLTVLTRASDGRKFPQEYFIRQFAEVRAAAIKGSEQHGLAPCPELAGLQMRDLRRTLIVRLAEAEVDLPGIAAISGHKIEVCKQILETYLPRTGKMAEAAIEKLEAHRAQNHTPLATMARASGDRK
ncbi:MAG: hypothetical protein WDA25_01125 [Paracoccaceae bacterium]